MDDGEKKDDYLVSDVDSSSVIVVFSVGQRRASDREENGKHLTLRMTAWVLREPVETFERRQKIMLTPELMVQGLFTFIVLAREDVGMGRRGNSRFALLFPAGKLKCYTSSTCILLFHLRADFSLTLSLALFSETESTS